MSKKSFISHTSYVVLIVHLLTSSLVGQATKSSFHVQQSNTLCPKERNVYDLRKSKAQQTLNSLYQKNLEINEVPTMAVALSGGGCRAAF